MTAASARDGAAPPSSEPGALPQPAAAAPSLPEPQDRRYPGLMILEVDATDVARCIFRVRQTIPVAAPGELILLYPKWIPGFHSPAAAIELFAGLEIWAGDARLPWRRHPVEVHAFYVDVPEGITAVLATFQFLSPTAESQGTIAVTPAMTAVRWAAMVLYPAGYFARQIEVQASLRLPPDWTATCALDVAVHDGPRTTYAPVPLDDLVDAPVLAGRWVRAVELDESGRVRLALVADRADMLDAKEDQLAPHRALIKEADALFGARHYERYVFLTAVSDELGGGGVEHQQCCEVVVPGDYFTAWAANAPKRDVFAHELVHVWNGKFRRGADSWTASFEKPIRNSLMWVYEGLTQYWGEVLAARSGLWSRQQALDTLARTAAIYDTRPGGRWRPLSDTTRDPIIASRQPLPWASWQRSEDYYSEGQLLWLDIDTLIRERSEDRHSLDDFARRFFGCEDGRTTTSTYEFADIVAVLDLLAPGDWTAFLTDRLETRQVGAPLDGLQRGGYRLVYRKAPSDFAMATDASNGVANLRFSIGLAAATDGTLQEVIWEGPAFHAGLVAGARILAVNGRAFETEALRQAVTDAEQSGGIELLVQRGKRLASATITYDHGHRYPHLEPVAERRRLDDILASRTVHTTSVAGSASDA
jgi:predicted metalloprotease with PDZ domain